MWIFFHANLRKFTVKLDGLLTYRIEDKYSLSRDSSRFTRASRKHKTQNFDFIVHFQSKTNKQTKTNSFNIPPIYLREFVLIAVSSASRGLVWKVDFTVCDQRLQTLIQKVFKASVDWTQWTPFLPRILRVLAIYIIYSKALTDSCEIKRIGWTTEGSNKRKRDRTDERERGV